MAKNEQNELEMTFKALEAKKTLFDEKKEESPKMKPILSENDE
jgi:hypothetical protein